MRSRLDSTPGSRPVLAALCALVVTAGCQTRPALERAGVEVKPPSAWKAVSRTSYDVPGTPLAAWSGPRDASLVVYRTLPIPKGGAEALAEGYANRHQNLPGMKVVSRGVHNLGEGLRAARVVVVGPGAGDRFAPSGTGKPIPSGKEPLIPTRQVVFAIPRSDDTIWLCWHYPESAKDEITPQVETTLESLQITSDSSSSSSYR